MKSILLFITLFPAFTTAQKAEDTKIIVTLNDNVDLYKKVKIALVNTDFIVKDNYNLDTLTTYSREFTSFPGFCVVTVVLINNTASISGFYGLKRIDEFGYTQSNKNYQKIMYYRGSKTWDLLVKVAEGIGGLISFSR